MHEIVRIPHSKVKESILFVLKEEGFIEDYKVVQNKFPDLEVKMKYYNGTKVIRKIERVSKPGLRTYVRSQNLEKILNGQGISIVSTSQGVFSDRVCRDKRLGGELLCKVW
jgi:small subunit ribosomal protein S8